MSAITIIANSYTLELLPNTRIQLKFKNPILNTNAIPAARSLPFNLPNSPLNRKALGFPEDLQLATYNFKVPVTLIVSGSKFFNGLLHIRKAAKDLLSVDLNDAIGIVWNDIKAKTLKEFNFGHVEYLKELKRYWYARMKVSRSGGVSPFQIDLGAFSYNVVFNGNADQTLNELAAEIESDQASHKGRMVWSYDTKDSFYWYYYVRIASVPVSSNLPGAIVVGGGSGLELDELIFDHTPNTSPSGDYSNLRTHINSLYDREEDYERCWGEQPYRFPQMYNEGAYNGATPGSPQCYLNQWLIGNGEYTLAQGTGSNILPFLRLPWVLKKVFANNSLSLKSKWLANGEINNLLLYSNVVWDYIIDENYTTDFVHAIDINRHMPDISVSDLLVGLKQLFALGYFVNYGSQEIEIIPAKEILTKSTYIDLTDLASPSDYIEPIYYDGFELNYTLDYNNDDLYVEEVKDISQFNVKDAVTNKADLPSSGNGPFDLRLVKVENKWYRWNIYNSTWSVYCANLNAYKRGNGELNINAPVATFLLLADQDIDDTSMLLGNGLLNSEAAEQDAQQTLLKLAFWLPPADRTSFPPKASPTIYDDEGNAQGTYSLLWNGNEGLYNQWWKRLISILESNRRVKASIRLNESHVNHMAVFKEPVMINSIKYIVDEINMPISAKHGIEPSEVFLLKKK